MPKSVTLRSDLCQITEALIIPAIFHLARNRSDRSVLILALLLVCFFPVQASVAATASEAFEDGNRLFRDDLYWAALLRYQQAFEAGMDTPLLHYNVGIAHYRAKQHIRARDSFSKALASSSLRVITHYNLGLNAYAANNVDEALTWFRLARDQDENAQIGRLAGIAIARIQTRERATDPFLVRAEEERKARDIANFEFRTQVGFGADDNAFRAPSQSYIDFADPALPLIVPVVQSGAYLPVSVRAKYSINNFEHESFFGAYKMTGRYYTDVELKNANEFSHELSFGSEYKRREDTPQARAFQRIHNRAALRNLL